MYKEPNIVLSVRLYRVYFSLCFSLIETRNIDGEKNDHTDLNPTFANKSLVYQNYFLIICALQLYDHDKDGILNFKESQKVLRCLGLRVSEDQAKILIKKVSADRFGYSMSFNEYLRLVSNQRRREPDEACLLGTYS